MKIISFGENYLDYYFSKNILVGVCGGKANTNILANLSKYYETIYYYIGNNDIQNDIAIKSLNDLNIKTILLENNKYKTNIRFINNKGISLTCPYCQRIYDIENPVNYEKINSFIEEDDIIIVDNLSNEVMNIINNINNKCFLFLNNIEDINYLDKEEIVELFNNFYLIYLTDNVISFIKKKFAIDVVDLDNLIDTKLLVISYSTFGMDFIYDGEVFEKRSDNKNEIVDISGAEEARYALIIKVLLDKKYIIDEKTISLMYMSGCTLFNFVSKSLGARIHLEPLYKVNNYHECICKNIEIEEKDI